MGWQKLYAPSTCITFVAVFTGLLFHKIMIIRKKKHLKKNILFISDDILTKFDIKLRSLATSVNIELCVSLYVKA